MKVMYSLFTIISIIGVIASSLVGVKYHQDIMIFIACLFMVIIWSIALKVFFKELMKYEAENIVSFRNR